MQSNKSFRLFSYVLLGLLAISFISLISPMISAQQNSSRNSATPKSAVNVNAPAVGKVSNPDNPLGQITMERLSSFPSSYYNYSQLISDESSGFVTISNRLYATQEVVLNNTVIPASNATKTVQNAMTYYNLTVCLNESYTINYNNNSQNHVFSIMPYYQPVTFVGVYINDSIAPISNYTISPVVSGSNINWSCTLNYTSQFNANPNGTLIVCFQYNYDFPISSWSVSPTSDNHYITNVQENITETYHDAISLGFINTYNFTADFNITLPNADVVYNGVLNTINSLAPKELIDYLQYNNIYRVLNVIMNYTAVTLDFSFTANFTVQMQDVVYGLWCADRLVDGLSIRQRDYRISVSDGPKDLRLTNIWINETGIYYANDYLGVGSISSALGRPVNIENMNISIGEPSSVNATYVDGVSFLGYASGAYYIVAGEEDVITIQYSSSHTLSCLIADQINNPLEGYQVRIYFGTQPYGSQITWKGGAPYPTLFTDAQGQITISYIPVGNFTAEIFDSNGNFVYNQTVYSLTPLNFVKTTVLHFPSVILSYTGIFVAILLIGIALYKRKQI
jgi:hypothetical protein